MKRSEINAIQVDAKQFLDEHSFLLPPWAYNRPADWATFSRDMEEIKEIMLGCDVTDFGSGNFKKRGLFLFTIRNGNPHRDRKPYAEKIMIVDVEQETPMHFHRHKMEDIINRGGGKLIIELHASNREEKLSDKPLEVSVDGIRRKLSAGSRVALNPGESICLEPFQYHSFWAEGKRCLVGEVSMANDDVGDNRFLEELGRFPKIEEDVEALHLLVSDYEAYLKVNA